MLFLWNEIVGENKDKRCKEIFVNKFILGILTFKILGSVYNQSKYKNWLI